MAGGAGVAVPPAELARRAGGRWCGGRKPAGVSGFSFDTRTLRPGECFVALRSERRDGHDFLAAAADRGATCALVERETDSPLPQLQVDDTLLALGRLGAAARRSFEGPVVAITGSCGKTSTKEMLRLLLGGDAVHATPGNWNNRIGVPMTLLGLDPGHHACGVVEAGINQPGEMDLLGEMIAADLVLLTHIGPAHLEGLGTEERVAEEKAGLARRALPDAPVFLPGWCLRFPALRLLAGRCVVALGEDEAVPTDVADWFRLRPEPAGAGMQKLVMEGPGAPEGEFELASPSAGAAANAALALAAAHRLGVAPADLRERLAAWRPASDRGAVRQRDGRLVYVDCYNANPASVADALDAFKRIAPPDGSRLFVLGTMEELGGKAAALHVATGGRVRPGPSDRVLLVGPEPLTDAYREGLLASGTQPDRIRSADSAAAFHSDIAGFEGAVFLKGSRRHALEQLLEPSPES